MESSKPGYPTNRDVIILHLEQELAAATGRYNHLIGITDLNQAIDFRNQTLLAAAVFKRIFGVTMPALNPSKEAVRGWCETIAGAEGLTVDQVVIKYTPTLNIANLKYRSVPAVSSDILTMLNLNSDQVANMDIERITGLYNKAAVAICIRDTG